MIAVLTVGFALTPSVDPGFARTTTVAYLGARLLTSINRHNQLQGKHLHLFIHHLHMC